MKKMLSLFLVALVSILLGFSCGADKDELSLNIYSPIGTVLVISGGAQKVPKDGDSLNIGDSISTGALSSADILLGNIGIVRIYENSLVHIKSLIDPDTGNTRIDMDRGKLYSTLNKLKKGSYQVKTPTAVASIRGTSFRMSAAPNDSRLDVIDGKVQVNPVENNVIIEDVKELVAANQTIRVDRAAVIDAVKNKRKLRVFALKPDELRQIRNEIKSINPDRMKKLRKVNREKMEKKIKETRENIKKAQQKLKLKQEEMLEKMREKKEAGKEKREERKQVLRQKFQDNKQAFRENVGKLKDRIKSAQQKNRQKKNPASNLSL